MIQHEKGIKEGSWDSIHVVSVSFEGSNAKYRVASTVFLRMESSNDSYGNLDIAGSLSKSVQAPYILTFYYRERRQWPLTREAEMTPTLQTLES